MAALYGIYAFVVPDVAGSGDRGDALRGFAPAAVLAAGSGLLWRWHWSELWAVSEPAAP